MWCSSQGAVERWSAEQFAQIIHYGMRAMQPKLIGIPLARAADHKPEVPVYLGLHAREGVLDDDCPRGAQPRAALPASSKCPEQVCRPGVGRGLYCHRPVDRSSDPVWGCGRSCLSESAKSLDASCTNSSYNRVPR